MTHRTEPLDSGHRQSFDTGAVRDTPEGKGRYDLLPYEPKRRWAIWTEAGIKKYGERNWERGIPLMRFLDSASRHLSKLIAGHTDEDHAAAVMWNVAGYIQTEKWIEDGVLPSSLDDRPRRGDKPHVVTLNTLGAETGRYQSAVPNETALNDQEADVYDEEEADGYIEAGGPPYDPVEATRRDIDEVVRYIRDRLRDGPVSGITMVGELIRAGYSYSNIIAGRDKAGVSIITINDIPHWTL